MEENSETKKEGEKNPNKNSLKIICIVLISAFAVLTIISIILSICSLVKANDTEKRFNNFADDFVGVSDDNEETDEPNEVDYEIDDDEMAYGLPKDVDFIDLIEIAYNNYNDFITIYPDDSVRYSTYDNHQGEISETIPTDTGKILRDFFDNDLKYLGDNRESINDDWSVEVWTVDFERSYVGGAGEEPEWLKKILDDVNVDVYGYKSRKN